MAIDHHTSRYRPLAERGGLGKYALCGALAVVVSMLAVPGHLARAASVPDAGQLLRQNQQPSVPAAQQPEEVIESPGPRPVIKLPEGQRIAVRQFRVTGSKSFTQEQLGELVKPWAGRDLDFNGLNEAAGAITRYYQNKGFLLAYAYLPQQKIQDGVVEIAVLEGMIDNAEIATAQDVRLSDQVIQSHLEGLTATPTVKQEDLERRLLLLNDIPGVVARASFAPGSRPGTADMVVSVVEDAAFEDRVYFNNYGIESSGEYRLGVNFGLHNLFGYGDSTQVYLQGSEKGRLANGGINTKVPVGGQGWTVEAGVSHLTYYLGGTFASIAPQGEANVVHLGAGYPLVRSLERNLQLQGGYDHKIITDGYAFGVSGKKHSDQLGVTLSADNRDEWLGGGRTRGSFAYNFGYLSVDRAGSPALVTNGAGQFGKISLDASRSQQLAPNWTLYGRLSGQYAFDNLDSSEKFGLSGPYAVRAYSPGESSVDSGGVFTMELNRAWLMTGGTLNGKLFYDYGYGRISVNPVAGAGSNFVTLQGGGLGVDWNDGSSFDYSLTAAWRGNRVPTAGEDRQPYVYFQLSRGF